MRMSLCDLTLYGWACKLRSGLNIKDENFMPKKLSSTGYYIYIGIEKLQTKNGSHFEHNVTRFWFDSTLIFLPCPFSFDGT